jgi:uncharacterized paraquat-inducible protein A
MLILKIILFAGIAILFILLCIRASEPEPEPEEPRESCQHCRYSFYSSADIPCNRCRKGSGFVRSELEGQELWD